VINHFLKTKHFNCWADKENLTDQKLCSAMAEVEKG